MGVIILVARFANKEERTALHSRWLFVSLVLAVIGISIWPLLQVVKFGMPLARVLNLEEMAMIADPAHFGARPYLEIPFRLNDHLALRRFCTSGGVLFHSGKTITLDSR